jgi:hypothetical protein
MCACLKTTIGAFGIPLALLRTPSPSMSIVPPGQNQHRLCHIAKSISTSIHYSAAENLRKTSGEYTASAVRRS